MDILSQSLDALIASVGEARDRQQKRLYRLETIHEVLREARGYLVSADLCRKNGGSTLVVEAYEGLAGAIMSDVRDRLAGLTD